MTTPTTGIHHITAIAGDPQRNLDFYAGTLGLRFVKRTVNFDDPGTYHFYYGDRVGTPGTLLTFFPWAGAFPGRPGVGQATVTGFLVPAGALPYWEDRLGQAGVTGVTRRERFGTATLRFADPDGMGLELVAGAERPDTRPWHGAVPAASAISGFHGVSLRLRDTGPTVGVLQEVLGLRPAGGDGTTLRFAPEAGPSYGVVDLTIDPAGGSGSLGAGSVHHIAWRATDERAQLAARSAVLGHGLGVTPVVDRQYFRSIYFREPGGVLFEVATDGPGFMIDESEAALGASLRLPPQYEAERAAIEAVLAPITVPGSPKTGVEA